MRKSRMDVCANGQTAQENVPALGRGGGRPEELALEMVLEE